jgi:FAD/FMN-containing dehydrogenase
MRWINPWVGVGYSVLDFAVQYYEYTVRTGPEAGETISGWSGIGRAMAEDDKSTERLDRLCTSHPGVCKR